MIKSLDLALREQNCVISTGHRWNAADPDPEAHTPLCLVSYPTAEELEQQTSYFCQEQDVH